MMYENILKRKTLLLSHSISITFHFLEKNISFFIRNQMKIGFQFDLDINKHCCMSSFFALIISHMRNSSNNPPVVAKAHLRSYRVREKKNICGPKNVPWGKLRSYEGRSSLCRAILLSVMVWYIAARVHLQRQMLSLPNETCAAV